MSRLKERHPTIPGLVRLPRTAAQDLYPYLRTERATAPRAKQQIGRLLSNAARGATSPLGGQATSDKEGKR
jgi:hypothetical protein